MPPSRIHCEPGRTGLTSSVPRQTSPGGHGLHWPVLGTRMYSCPGMHCLHSWSSADPASSDVTSSCPAGQLSRT
eukprot:857372-Rhodomonas_salina.2